MDGWGRRTYGDPCRGCGFDWEMTVPESVAVVSDIPREYAELLTDATGEERYPTLAWSASAYVCHVGDNLRIWAERLVGSVREGRVEVESYDEKALAEARGYGSIALVAAMWSLGRSVEAWVEAVGQGPRRGTVLVHPERGPLTLGDVVAANAHDAFHHGWDIERTLGPV
ncbi:MAG: DinB family protein [Acidimicrobiales bacterium]